MKRSNLILILIPLLLLSACSFGDSNIQDKIIAPSNKTIPIQGKWVIVEKLQSSDPILMAETAPVEELDPYIGREVLFNKAAIVVADDYAENPTFKYKNVDAQEYLIYKYKISPRQLNIGSENMQIITVLKNNQLFYEFFKYDEDKLLIFIDDSFYSMRKLVDQVSLEEVNRYIKIESNMFSTFDTIELVDLDSGVLLGIRTPIYDEERDLPDWQYKTIWIRSENRNISKYQLDKLLVPRKSGFWLVGVDRIIEGSSATDKIVAIPQFSEIRIMESAEIITDNLRAFSMPKPTILKNIQFVGNDYISVERIEVDQKNRKTLQIYALDNIEDERPIKLSDLVQDGDFLFKEGSENIQAIGENVVLNETNVGLVRMNGYWTLKGRINYRQNEEELFKDFNIRAIPPKTMVSYDELGIPWDFIKARFPRAIDAFSSPNGEFLIVVVSDELLIYPTESGEILSTEPLDRISLPKNSSIIMSEWSVGRYPAIWQEEIIKQGAVMIEE